VLYTRQRISLWALGFANEQDSQTRSPVAQNKDTAAIRRGCGLGCGNWVTPTCVHRHWLPRYCVWHVCLDSGAPRAHSTKSKSLASHSVSHSPLCFSAVDNQKCKFSTVVICRSADIGENKTLAAARIESVTVVPGQLRRCLRRNCERDD
jgi:hypothetical protein